MKHSALKLILCGSALVTGLAAASPITITDVAGSWIKATPGATVVSGVNTDTIKWGNSDPDYQSGYAFTGNAAPTFLSGEGEAFSIGQFTHFNHPIGSAPLTGAQLKVTATVNLDGATHVLESIFNVNHWETVNSPVQGGNCGNGESRESTINRYGCADRVKLALDRSSSTSYIFGSNSYYVDITGFFHEGELAHELWTQERNTSTSLLSGIIRSGALEVPEPSSLVLLALSLMGFFSKKVWRRA